MAFRSRCYCEYQCKSRMMSQKINL
ncbi:MAG: DUF3927 domain-containing protein [Ruminococcus albus]|nr:DUF3927 domain-containing protein [Ruminococcus albus]